MSADATLAALRTSGVVPVVRFRDRRAADRAIDTLLRVGFRTFEVTLTIPDAPALIRRLADTPGVLVGAGTVTTEAEAGVCLDAGARFLVSPFAVPGLPELATAAGAAGIVGALTPSEIHRAATTGADAVKVFPAHAVGGPSYLQAVRAVLPEVPLIPTGGVTLDNLPAYFDAGCPIVGVGSDLFAGPDPAARARRYLDAVTGYRAGAAHPQTPGGSSP